MQDSQRIFKILLLRAQLLMLPNYIFLLCASQERQLRSCPCICRIFEFEWGGIISNSSLPKPSAVGVWITKIWVYSNSELGVALHRSRIWRSSWTHRSCSMSRWQMWLGRFLPSFIQCTSSTVSYIVGTTTSQLDY